MTSIPTRKIEMKTAIELAASLSARYLDTKQMLPDELAHKAAEMLIQQAEQIEALTKMLVISDDTHQTWMKANAPRGWIDDLRIERDALKADAQRWKTIKPHFYFQFKGGQGFWNCSISSESWTVDGIIPDAAIDAMKGAT